MESEHSWVGRDPTECRTLGSQHRWVGRDLMGMESEHGWVGKDPTECRTSGSQLGWWGLPCPPAQVAHCPHSPPRPQAAQGRRPHGSAQHCPGPAALLAPYLDLLPAQVRGTQLPIARPLPAALEALQAQVKLGAVPQAVPHPAGFGAPCNPRTAAVLPGLSLLPGQDWGLPSPRCTRWPLGGRQRLQLLLVPHGTGVPHTAQPHVRVPQHPQRLRRPPFPDGLVDGGCAQSHCGNGGGVRKGGGNRGGGVQS